MPEVGVRELKTRASAILRDVREHQAQYTVTYRGKPVGVLSPFPNSPKDSVSGKEAWDEFFRVGDELMRKARGAEKTSTDADAQATWDELLQLGEEIGRDWCSPRTSVEILSEMRR